MGKNREDSLNEMSCEGWRFRSSGSMGVFVKLATGEPRAVPMKNGRQDKKLETIYNSWVMNWGQNQG